MLTTTKPQLIGDEVKTFVNHYLWSSVEVKHKQTTEKTTKSGSNETWKYYRLLYPFKRL